jgi:leucyl aminopeptidase
MSMRHALSNESWKSLLPDSYDWLSQVKVAVAAGSVSDAHHIVGVISDEKEKDKFRINAPALAQDFVAKVTVAATNLGWKPSAGPLHLNIDKVPVTLVPQSSVKVSSKQISRQIGLDAAKAVKELKMSKIAICIGDALSELEVFNGLVSGFYNHVGFKGTRKKDTSRFPSSIVLAGSKASADDIKSHIELSRAEAVTRFLQDAPPNYLNPLKFAEIALDIAKESGLPCRILDKEQMTKLGMGSMLSVSDGSVVEPRTIIIEIEGKDNSKTVAFVGKGLTFDAGGISIKPSVGMEEMKYDMSGGAAVLGTAMYFAKVKPPVKVVCVIAASENMPSGSATRPGDIVRAMNGKTIEIHNTDAEGRLVLADVLHLAITEYKPDIVVDIATLTGAVLFALGCVGSAVMTNDTATAEHVIRAGEEGGEPLWQLPLWPELEKEVKSDIADLKNIAKGNVKGGTIMGGMFLKEFVGDAKWVHLDIAGTGWNCQALGYPSAGGSAFGMRTLINTAELYKR